MPYVICILILWLSYHFVLQAKEINRGDMTSAMNSMDNAERSDRMAISGSSKQWADQPVKMPV